MSTIPEKMAKQFTHQRTRHATSGDQMDLFVSVDILAEYLAAQTRMEVRTVRPKVKAELERLAGAGQVRRWLEVFGQSYRADRVDHYFLTAEPERSQP